MTSCACSLLTSPPPLTRCALHPTMRENWAAAWARHLTPGGELITLVYPVDPSQDVNQGGGGGWEDGRLGDHLNEGCRQEGREGGRGGCRQGGREGGREGCRQGGMQAGRGSIVTATMRSPVPAAR